MKSLHSIGWRKGKNEGEKRQGEGKKEEIKTCVEFCKGENEGIL
jgi:hypothetical protein